MSTLIWLNFLTAPLCHSLLGLTVSFCRREVTVTSGTHNNRDSSLGENGLDPTNNPIT